MTMRLIRIKFPVTAAGYDITIRHGSLPNVGLWARRSLRKDTEKIAVVSNPTVFKHHGENLVERLRAAGFDVSVWLMKDGEEHKSFRNVERALDLFAESEISRTDAVLALGGGVVGDLAGFAAAIYLRGIAFLQVPTTLLSMIDSSVGGKTGVNSATGKNRIGAFHQPSGVLIDTGLLRTLPQREITAGLCEAVKQGVLSGGKLFDQTATFLEFYSGSNFGADFSASDREFLNKLDYLIKEQVSFKASIVRSDERESTRRTDARSRKILNFGHTLAHALEKVTNYNYFKHGEAVGYGILYAAELSKMLALIDKNVVNLLNDVVHRSGTLPPLNKLDPEEVFEAFRFDKKLVSGALQMILIKGIGKPVIINASEIKRSTHIKALKKLFNQ